MEMMQNRTFDEERALYGSKDIFVKDCSFDGPADGESAFKECSDVQVEHGFFNLRYPFWHDHGLKISNSEMTELCRAALWYSDHIEITKSKLHGIKALRECSKVKMRDCDIISPEFGWSVRGIEMEDCTAQSEYFMMRSDNLHFRNVDMKGKYSFQYIENAVFENCSFTHVSFSGSSLWGGRFINCRLKDCSFHGAELAMARFENCIFQDNDWEEARFFNTFCSKEEPEELDKEQRAGILRQEEEYDGAIFFCGTGQAGERLHPSGRI